MNHLVIVVLLAAKLLTLQGALHEMSVQQGVDPQLANCIVSHESNWDPQLVSAAQDTGLFQIIPSTAEWVAGEMSLTDYDLFDPVTNIRMGLWILERYPEWYSTLYLCQ